MDAGIKTRQGPRICEVVAGLSPENVFVIHLERADGGRQDLDLDAAILLYVNCPYFFDFLHGLVFGKGHSNIQEDYYHDVTIGSLQFIELIRAIEISLCCIATCASTPRQGTRVK